MKKINIFLAVDEKELQNEKDEIGNFIRDLNDKYENYDIYFRLITDDDSDVLTDDIKKSELFFILFSHTADEKIVQEFNTAYEFFKNNHNPKITTYIKKSENQDESVVNFMKHLDEELGHYYNQYENIDTIKLNIILQLKSLGLEAGKIEVIDNKLCINKDEIMTLDNIPFIFNNKDLNNLKEQYNKLDQEYWEYKDIIRKNPDDEKAFEKFSDINDKRSKIKDNIYQIENNIIELESSFISSSMDGKLSKRQIYAKKCLDDGDLEEAKNALSFEDLKSDGDKLLKIQEKQKEEMQTIVNELMQRVDILKLDINNNNRYKEIEEAFEEAVKLDEQGNLNRRSLYKYSSYLNSQNQYDKAIKFANKYKEYLNLSSTKEYYEKKFDEGIYYDNLSSIYNHLGIIYYNIGKYEEAEKIYLELIEIDKKLVEINPKLYQNNLSIAYNNLGLDYLLFEDAKFELAKDCFMKAIEIDEKILTEDNDDYYRVVLSNSYNNYALLLEKYSDFHNALKYYRKSTDIRIDLVKKYPQDEYKKELLSASYHQLGKYALNISKYDIAEDYLLKDMKLMEELYESNSQAYMSRISKFLSNHWSFLFNNI